MSTATLVEARRPPGDAPELVLTHARLVLPDEALDGTVVLLGGRIHAIDGGRSRLPGARDLAGDTVVPGLIDLHTDNLEQHYQPRSGVEWDAVSAALGHDTQIAGSGITTVYDSLTLGAASGWDARAEMIGPMVEGLRTAVDHRMLRGHFLHMRCEATHPSIVPTFESYVDDPLVRFMSIMDHAPGDRQLTLAGYREFGLRIFRGDEAAVERHIAELIDNSNTFGAEHRRRLAQVARERGLRFASHDDASRAQVEEAADLGAVLTEFPTSVEAADAAHERRLAVLAGAPNLIRGGSHSGNVAATALAERDRLDILASDFIPASLVQAAFKLTHDPFGWSLPQALATVTSAPAAAAGLEDRGRLDVGRRADLARIETIQSRPVVRTVWPAGRRVA